MLRVVVEVADRGGEAGWSVALRGWGPDAALAPIPGEPYEMAAIAVPDLVGGFARRLPRPPAGRLPAAGQPHRALCDGDPAAVQALLDRLRSRSGCPGDATLYGRWLFESLLAPRWDAIVAHPRVAADRAVEIALSWPPEQGELHRLVWEAMHDGEAPLAGHPRLLVAITRLVPVELPAGQTVTELPRMLFASGARLSDATIRPGAMYMGLLRAMDSHGWCLAHALQEVSLDSLRGECATFQPHVVHLVAHGQLEDGNHAALLLRDAEPARASDLLRSLSAGGRPAAVILSACNTATPGDAPADAIDPVDASPLAAQLVAAGIPIVTAMAGEVSEPACRLYTRRLVTALLDGRSIVEASAHGRRSALVDAARPDDDLDWARPSVFLAASADPSVPLVDASAARRLIELGRSLNLRQEPLFVGRSTILAEADGMPRPGSGVGVLAILAGGSTSQMGGTRLLREIGWRALRGGHLPLMLGPYADTSCPRTLVDLVREVFTVALDVLSKLDLPAFAPVTLALDPAHRRDELERRLAAAPSRALARSILKDEVRAMAERRPPLDPASVVDVLRDDLETLVQIAVASGRPFVEGARPLVLLDDVDAWEDALTALLAMVGNDGFGRPGRPIPVVLTGSRSENGGKLEIWSRNEGGTGVRKYPLEEFSGDEKLVGYQWILLHPWESRRGEDEMFKRTYTVGLRSPLKPAAWREIKGKPRRVIEEWLFAFAHSMAESGQLRWDDDDLAFSRYVSLHPEYRL